MFHEVVETLKMLTSLSKYFGQTVNVTADFGLKRHTEVYKSKVWCDDYAKFLARMHFDETDTLIMCRADYFGYKHVEVLTERLDSLTNHPVFDCGRCFALSFIRVAKVGNNVTITFNWDS